ncbi:MAG: DUF2318 domain-containing protein [Firmicutes bacterium]|nr:DUF2318 domain-containing protein [Bacillota bacterium]
MLKYLVQLTFDLMPAGLIIGMLLAYIKFNFPRLGSRILYAACCAGVAAAAVMAVIINTPNPLSKKLNLGYIAYIDLWTIAVFAIGLLLLILLSIPILQRITKKAGQILTYLAASAIVVSLLFYCLPAVFAYPKNFNVGTPVYAQGSAVFTTDFLFRFIGVILGALLAVIAFIAVYKIERRMKSPWHKVFPIAMALILLLRYSGIAVKLMLARRIIHQTHFLFTMVKIGVNYSKWFLIAEMIVALAAAVCLYVTNLKVREEYSNPAQHRKIKARMRNNHRWAVVLAVCVLLAGINVTVIDAYNNKAPDEAPVEETQVVGTDVIVPLTAVEDGHLHRFGYTTDDGVLVKFIVVQKPGSSAYGVGLDACEICGDAGYFERDEQIVCRRCDVVMNKNTIGFKGGCNPIVIDYRVENGQIIVPIQTLVDHQDEFR